MESDRFELDASTEHVAAAEHVSGNRRLENIASDRCSRNFVGRVQHLAMTQRDHVSFIPHSAWRKCRDGAFWQKTASKIQELRFSIRPVTVQYECLRFLKPSRVTQGGNAADFSQEGYFFRSVGIAFEDSIEETRE